MPGRTSVTVAGRTLSLSHLDKVIYPATPGHPEPVTKGQVIAYYDAIAPFLLPHLAGRIITRKRWPDGVDKQPFFEKNLPGHSPDWIQTASVAHRERATRYPVATSAADLVWLAQQAALELHVPQWRVPADTWEHSTSAPGARNGGGTVGRVLAKDEARSDRIVLDLDPGPGATLADCAELALRIRDMLAALGIPARPVTSGSKGIHVYAALGRIVSPAAATQLARGIGDELVKQSPEKVVTTMAKVEREGKVFVDWSQNSGNKTTISPYSLRGRPQPHVAAPRRWNELDDTITQLDLAEVLARAERDGDLFTFDAPDGTVDLAARRRARARPAAEPIPDERPAEPPTPARVASLLPAALARPEPMLASDAPITRLSGRDWAFEGKWDGYRAIARHVDGRTQLISRSGRDITGEFPAVASAIAAGLGPINAVLDGELVVLADGRPDFHAIASRSASPAATVRYYAFDLLFLGDTSLLRRPWTDRRMLLEELAPTLREPIEIPPLLEVADGPAAAKASLAAGWEGFVAKRRTSTYQPGKRVHTWVKHKNWRDTEAVVGGWTNGAGSRAGRIGALLLGLPAETGLRYIGRVGTGFTEAELDALAAELSPHRRRTSPFLDAPAEVADSVWVLPTMVVEVRYFELSSSGRIRFPSWRGIRRDKLPGDVESEL